MARAVGRMNLGRDQYRLGTVIPLARLGMGQETVRRHHPELTIERRTLVGIAADDQQTAAARHHAIGDDGQQPIERRTALCGEFFGPLVPPQR